MLVNNAACILCNDELAFFCLEQFNECDTDLGAEIGYSLVDLELRQQDVRSREMPVGNLAADAFFDVATRHCGGDRVCPQFAFENGGAIRYDNPCGERDFIRAGTLHELHIRQAFPFKNNKLSVYEITGHDLKLALEHSVDQLGLELGVDKGGWFLQVSRLSFEVDCGQPAQSINSYTNTIIANGSRIVDGSLMYRSDNSLNDDDATWEPIIVDRDHTYFFATNSFIGSGGDGFISLVQRQVTDDGETAVLSGTDVCDSKFLCNLSYHIEDNGSFFSDAEAIIDYVKRQDTVEPYVQKRFLINPNCYVH